jgi:ATP-dependent Clp protease adaptor protein ClpS|tara:strand:+ start:3089 stop:3394 length:306 start_codon:yes stop_codon:yes gene_type:complete
MTTNADIKIDEKIKHVIVTPKKYKVILLNDQTTPMEWVTELLISIFKHSETTAQQLMLIVHNEDSAVCGIYNYEIAEQKSVEAAALSKDKGFPLQFRLEQE